MNKFLRLALFCFFCLTALSLTQLSVPNSYAATFTTNRPFSGAPCEPRDPQNTGISYDANAYTMAHTDDPNTQLPMGMFRFAGSNAPAIGAWACMDSGLTGLSVGNVGANFYNLRTTVNGVTTQTIPDHTVVFNFQDHMQIELYLQADQQYTFQVQSCSRNFLGHLSCSQWSPHLILNTAANSFCKNGYVWREATTFDHVCVIPDERTQVANDNSQAASRIDPNGAYGPQSCISGYVWREAFGGDKVCVIPNERQEAQSDNSHTLDRMIAL